MVVGRVLRDQPQLAGLEEADRELLRSLGMNKRHGSTKVAKVIEQCSKDPEFFIFGGFCRTFNERSRSKPRDTFPTDKTYLRAALQHIHNKSTGDVAAISKSRQLMLTWLCCAYAVWEARFHPQARVMIQSKKAEDAWNLVYRNSWVHGRCAFIERAMPLFMRCEGLTPTRGELWYPNGSVIAGIPQGPDMFRSYTASLVICDEACFQDAFEDAYKAALPMAKGYPDDPDSGGRIILVTTAAAGSYYATLVEQDEESQKEVA